MQNLTKTLHELLYYFVHCLYFLNTNQFYNLALKVSEYFSDISNLNNLGPANSHCQAEDYQFLNLKKQPSTTVSIPNRWLNSLKSVWNWNPYKISDNGLTNMHPL